MKLIPRLNTLTFAIVSLIICSCSKSNSGNMQPVTPGNADSIAATLSAPVTINVYPGIAGNGSGRIYIKTAAVGNITIALPMLFDTGSAGVTLNALNLFPSSLVDVNGFKFKAGQDTIQYNGITVTKFNMEKVFGSAAVETRQIGNVGYAKLTIGDAAGAVTTLKQPILFYYQTLEAGNLVANGSGLGDVLGINTTYNSFQGVADSLNTLKVISPFKYINYDKSLLPGFKVNAIQLNGCDIKTNGSCIPQGLLTVGLTKTDEANYATNQLAQIVPQPVFTSPQFFPAYPVYVTYGAVIANATISNASKSRISAVLLDSGNPGMIFNFPADSINAAQNPVITLTTPSKSNYSYNFQTAAFKSIFNTSGSRSVYGIYFFTRFNFLEDYQNGIIGLKAVN